VPPAAIAADVAKLDTEIAAIEGRAIAGDWSAGQDAAVQILAQADKLAWPPLQARAHFVLGRIRAALMLPARADLIRAGELATAHHLDREAARAWAMAQQAAGYEQSADAVATLAPMARAAALRTGDKTLVAVAELKHARALVRLRKWKEGAAACKAAFEAVQALDKKSAIDEARDCMLESLVPLGERQQLDTLLAQIIADKTAELGPEHPTISDYLKVRVGQRLRTGDVAGARADVDQVMAIRRRAYPPGHYRIAEALSELADVVGAEGKGEEADQLNREALAMLDETKPEHGVLVTSLLIEIANREFVGGKREQALERFERATRLVRKRSGPNSLELAILLLNYGQYKASENVEAGLGLVNEARDILERSKDRRMVIAGAAAAIIATHAKRWADVIRICDEVLPQLGANDDPEQVALTKWLLARALREAKGDTKRARQLATEAKATYAKLGPKYVASVKQIDAFVAKLR
jgi:tetratricopeptide (TPR) repeat protein